MTDGTGSEQTRPDGVVELSARLLFSFLRGAARLAARFHVPLDRFTELAALAYFQELRSRSPRDLALVAERLGVSLRTAGTLNRRLRSDFLTPELEVEPLRALTDVLLDGPRRRSELLYGLEDADRDRLVRSLELLAANGWLDVDEDPEDPLYKLHAELRSFVSDDLDRRVDGLNHQLDILVSSVRQRFLAGNDETARARTWFFAARDEEVPDFIERTVRELRHGALDLEESALKGGGYRRYGVTLAITPVEEEET